MYLNFIKPLFDFLFSLLGLILLSPLFILITVLLYFANDGKPFFFQERPGKNERIFRIVKFRSMNNRRDAEGVLLPDERRLTPVGKIIRKTSLDEIPQLLNVLKGDMSFVGPRPLLVSYLPKYSQEQRKRHDVRPGITGWAQVNGRNALSWEDKFRKDVYYVENVGLLLDLKILYKTIGKVVKSENISSNDHVTMAEFKGTASPE